MGNGGISNRPLCDRIVMRMLLFGTKRLAFIGGDLVVLDGFKSSNAPGEDAGRHWPLNVEPQP